MASTRYQLSAFISLQSNVLGLHLRTANDTSQYTAHQSIRTLRKVYSKIQYPYQHKPIHLFYETCSCMVFNFVPFFSASWWSSFKFYECQATIFMLVFLRRRPYNSIVCIVLRKPQPIIKTREAIKLKRLTVDFKSVAVQIYGTILNCRGLRTVKKSAV